MTQLSNLLNRWSNVRARLVETVEKFADDELDFQPFPTSWTVRLLMLHIAHEENGEFNYGITQTLSDFPPEYDPLQYPNRAALQALMQTVHAGSLAYLAGRTDTDLEQVIRTPWGMEARLIELVEHLVEHEIHHRAELSLILGILGKQGLNA
jgi:uncharacterized damage-inducible protein DinB